MKNASITAAALLLAATVSTASEAPVSMDLSSTERTLNDTFRQNAIRNAIGAMPSAWAVEDCIGSGLDSVCSKVCLSDSDCAASEVCTIGNSGSPFPIGYCELAPPGPIQSGGCPIPPGPAPDPFPPPDPPLVTGVACSDAYFQGGFTRYSCSVTAANGFRGQIGVITTQAPTNDDFQLSTSVVITDGFDPLGTQTVASMQAELEAEGIAPAILAQGRDLILVDYTSGAASVLDNAEVLAESLRWVHERRSGLDPIALIGPSMGGLVARTALLSLEEQSPPGDRPLVASFIAFDAPLEGAVVPLSIQYANQFFLNDAFKNASCTSVPFTDQDDEFCAELRTQLHSTWCAASQSWSALNSPAARELLLRHVTTDSLPPLSQYESWQNNQPLDPGATAERQNLIEQLGDRYPDVPRTVAISNGGYELQDAFYYGELPPPPITGEICHSDSDCESNESCFISEPDANEPFGFCVEPNGELHLSLLNCGLSVGPLDLSIQLKAEPLSGSRPVFSADTDVSVPGIGGPEAHIRVVGQGLDYAPGGNFDWLGELVNEVLESVAGSNDFLRICDVSPYTATTYIPLPSALGVSQAQIDSYWNGIEPENLENLSPFDAVYTAGSSNESHVFLSYQTSTALLQELMFPLHFRAALLVPIL